jgi:hypothetical protein
MPLTFHFHWYFRHIYFISLIHDIDYLADEYIFDISLLLSLIIDISISRLLILFFASFRFAATQPFFSCLYCLRFSSSRQNAVFFRQSLRFRCEASRHFRIFLHITSFSFSYFHIELHFRFQPHWLPQPFFATHAL